MSELGQGSAFHFTLRLAVRPSPLSIPSVLPKPEEQDSLPDSDTLSAPNGFVQRSLSILVVEDNVFNQLVATRLLNRKGHRVEVAGSGKEALVALDRSSFDAVLMDVQMPEMDGLEVTRAIRKMEETTGGHVPIIAQTAHTMKGDRERCLAAGIDGYLSKPILVNELWHVIRQIGTLASDYARAP